MLRTLLMTMLTGGVMFAQTAHRIPFASTGNTIELIVSNESANQITGVRVKVTSIPAWLHVKSSEQTLEPLKPNSEKVAVFTFSVDKVASVYKEQKIIFDVISPEGETWTKEIGVMVAPPERFELMQNYPNPFNPVTNIEYILPKDSKVQLVVYNALGQEITTLVDKVVEAGYRAVSFDASNLPSGVYFYRVEAVPVEGNSFTQIKKMLLVK